MIVPDKEYRITLRNGNHLPTYTQAAYKGMDGGYDKGQVRLNRVDSKSAGGKRGVGGCYRDGCCCCDTARYMVGTHE